MQRIYKKQKYNELVFSFYQDTMKDMIKGEIS